ncbi:MAG: hypothetical protein FGF52_01685 [Candidatus Brockarchaeota archaeon]|nr:hypothetical protein [Candidatus Brockarchaeota archaeon]
MEKPLGRTTINLSDRTVLIHGDYYRVFPFIISLIRMSEGKVLLFLDDFNTRTLVKEAGHLGSEALSKIMVSRFENLVQLDKALEQSEKMLLDKGVFKLIIVGSLPNAYLREISLHDSSSHSNILYLLNKILAFFSFLSKEYRCTGVLISSGGGLEGEENIPARRIFLYWVDYFLELRRCDGSRLLGRLVTKNGEEFNLCIPWEGNIKELDRIGFCNKDDCSRSF